MGFLLLSGGAVALPAHAMAPRAPLLPDYAVTLTAYNAVSEQTDDNPFETASGAYSNPEIVAARSGNLAGKLPFGTIIELDGSNISSRDTCGYNVVKKRIGYRVIADTMNSRYTDRIDILFSTESNYVMKDGREKNAGAMLGICNGASVRVVGHIDITNPNRLPKTQAELAAIVNGKSDALAVK